MYFVYNINGDIMKKNNGSKLFTFLIICLFILFGYLFRENITEFVLKEFVNDKFIVTYENNIYAKGNNEKYQTTDNFYPKNKQDIINLFFTALDGGWNDITFFCTNEYEECINDVTKLTDDEIELSKINNYVHPYNSYKKITLNYNTYGKVSITFDRLYESNEIEIINKKVDEILEQKITSNMTLEDKIRTIHDHIISNVVYDSESAEKVINNEYIDDFTSHKANGALIDGKAICGGYSDAMAIFLSKLNASNYKLCSDVHVWNYVLVDGSWYHLDLTWDDPVTDKNVIIHSFFLITDEELKKIDSKEHNYY